MSITDYVRKTRPDRTITPGNASGICNTRVSQLAFLISHESCKLQEYNCKPAHTSELAVPNTLCLFLSGERRAGELSAAAHSRSSRSCSVLGGASISPVSRGRSPGEALARRARHNVPKLVEIKLMCIRFQMGRAYPTSFDELHVEARQNQRPRHHHRPRHP